MSLAIYVIGVAGVVAVMLGSYFLGQRHHDRATDSPYEGGIVATGSARGKFSAHFYLIAMLFVIFDLESVFLVTWASAARTLGTPAFIHVTIFIAILLAALVYLWRVGALNVLSHKRRLRD